MVETLARLAVRIGAGSKDPRVVAYTLSSTVRYFPRTLRGLAAARRMAGDTRWAMRYVAAYVLGSSWDPAAADHAVLLSLAQDDNVLVRAALARGVAQTGREVAAFAEIGPPCVRIARHAQVRREWEARQMRGHVIGKA